jgi:nucleotide-binding universal stress UspA family protein
MSFINHIVVPVDMSPTSMAALHYAAFLGEHHGALLHILHVCQEDAEGGSGRQALDALLADAPEIAVRVAEVDTLLGEPAAAIVDVARAYRADVIVMGHGGDAQTGTSLDGNVFAEVAAAAFCGVVGVHPPASSGATFALCRSPEAHAAQQQPQAGRHARRRPAPAEAARSAESPRVVPH